MTVGLYQLRALRLWFPKGLYPQSFWALNTYASDGIGSYTHISTGLQGNKSINAWTINGARSYCHIPIEVKDCW